MRILSMATAGLIGVWGAAAQAEDWSYSGTFYLFAADTTARIGGVESELSFSDALENLDLALMGAVAATNGTWSMIVDAMYTDLSFSGPPPGGGGGGFTGTETRDTTFTITAYAAYEVYEAGDTTIDLGGGLRWFDTDTSITLTGPSPVTRSLADDWIDPVLMARVQTRFADRWVGTLIADYGGIESNRETSQLIATVGYELTDRWILRGGYRYFDVNNRIDGVDYGFKQSGPVFGATFNF